MGELAIEKRHQADDHDHHRPADPGRTEPVVFLTFVEHDLQRTQPDGQQAEADAIKLAGFGILDVGRIFDKAADENDGQDSDWNVDVKRPAPRLRFGEPSAEGRT